MKQDAAPKDFHARHPALRHAAEPLSYCLGRLDDQASADDLADGFAVSASCDLGGDWLHDEPDGSRVQLRAVVFEVVDKVVDDGFDFLAGEGLGRYASPGPCFPSGFYPGWLLPALLTILRSAFCSC